MKNAYSDVIGKDMTLDTGHTYLDPVYYLYLCNFSYIKKQPFQGQYSSPVQDFSL